MKSMILASVATLTLGVAGAMAQNAPATPTASGTSTADSGQFIEKESPGEFRAPKLVGVSVYDKDNKSVGKISDLLLDKDGAVKAVVIGIGGFLGIGQKDVAVPYSALHWQTEQRTVATSAGSPASGSTMGGNAGGLGSTMSKDNAPGTMNGNPPGGPAGTAANGAAPGTMGAPTTNGTAPGTMVANGAANQTQTATIPAAETEAYQGYPDRAVVDMSQDQLKSAPEFKYASNPAAKAMGAASDKGAMTPGGANNAQKP